MTPTGDVLAELAQAPQHVRAAGEAARYADGEALYRLTDLVHAGRLDLVAATVQRGRVLVGALELRGLAVTVTRTPG